MNQDYKNGLKKKIQACQSCDELKDSVSEILQTLQAQISDVTAQIAKLQPYLALLEVPTSPDEVVGWAKGLIDTLIKPLTAPIIGYQLQLVEYTALVAEITQEINNKVDAFTDCEIG